MWARFGLWASAHQTELQPCFEGTKANPCYGLTWWLDRPVSSEVEARLSKAMRALTHLGRDTSLPKDIVMAAGAGDQRLVLIPSLGLVVARQAGQILRRRVQGESHWSDAAFLHKLVTAFDAAKGS